MIKIRIYEDVEECHHIWKKIWPAERISDLWPVRTAFLEPFGTQPYFITAEENNEIKGLLALSWVESGKYYGYFPGETWLGKTWLEQNRILADGPETVNLMLENAPGVTHLRYLTDDSLWTGNETEDEIGYLFVPSKYGYSFDEYLRQFSSKSRKKLVREVAKLEERGVSFRYDNLADIDHLFWMSLDTFGERSYFNDARFLKSFENLIAYLHNNGLLRTTTVLIDGKIAAVDIGGIWQKKYTVLAGGANPEFPGVAKVINFHHFKWSCEQRFDFIDFLCGDFGWKEKLHLTPHPLYQMRTSLVENSQQLVLNQRRNP